VVAVVEPEKFEAVEYSRRYDVAPETAFQLVAIAVLLLVVALSPLGAPIPVRVLTLLEGRLVVLPAMA
jgi:hypothetical protein